MGLNYTQLCNTLGAPNMTTADDDLLKRVAGAPLEPFTNATDIYPHYVVFEKDGVTVPYT